MRRTARAIIAIGVTIVSAERAIAQNGGEHVLPVRRDARDAVFKAFEHYQVVLLGEVHWSVAEHKFIDGVLYDPRLPATVRDIAVEFANASYQPLIDRYVAGAEVPADSLRQIWQNVIVPMAWDSPLYATFFRTVREVNRKLPVDQKLRVVALDPPIRWAEVRNTDDIPRKWGYRDPVWFEVLDREVLLRHRKALVICGALHIIRRDPATGFLPAPIERAGLGDALDQRYPGAAYSIYPLLGTDGRLVNMWRPNGLGEIKGTTVGARTSHDLLPGSLTIFRMVDGKRVPHQLQENEYPPIEALVSAVAFYGSGELTQPDVRSFRDPAYVAELHRRSAIVQPMFGQDLDSRIDDRARLACAGSRKGAAKPGVKGGCGLEPAAHRRSIHKISFAELRFEIPLLL